VFRFELDKWTVSLLYDLNKKGRLDVRPEWQRGKVWDDRMKYHLIDTVLRDWPMGLVMLSVTDHVDPDGSAMEQYDVVDGQQRITTVFEYRDGQEQWTKKAPPRIRDFVSYSSLKSAQQERFDEYKVAVALMREYEQDDILDVYSRLQNSRPLQLGEKVKALPTEFKPMLRELTEHKVFGLAGGRYRQRDAHWNLAGQFFKSVYLDAPLDRQEFDSLQEFLRREPFDDGRARKAQERTSALLNLTRKVIEEAIELDGSFEKVLQSVRPLKWLFAGVYALKEQFAVSGKEHLLAKGLLEYHRAKETESTDEWKAYMNTGRTGRVDTEDVRACLEQMMNRIILVAGVEPLDPQRFFTPQQREEIYQRAGGKCEHCLMKLSKTNFHADHKKAHRHGGPTTLENGQALCTACNRKKSGSMGSREFFEVKARDAAKPPSVIIP